MKRRDLLKLSSVVGALAAWPALPGLNLLQAADDGEAAGKPFDRTKLIEQARLLAEQPFQQPPLELPGDLADLSFDQYREIRYRPERRLGQEEGLPFTLDLLHSGFIYQTPVRLFMVEKGLAKPVVYDPGMFDYGDKLSAPPDDADLPFSGIRAHVAIDQPDAMDEFLIIQGASYFRAVARHQNYGLAARGLAIKTGDPDGEEFPAFTALWIERPESDSRILVIHALLDSPSCTGAYRLTARPGDETVIDVEVALFAREDLLSVGLAPLTSMYLFGAANRAGFDDIRDAVHDSDGLQILTGGGERLWRPLANPRELQRSSFGDRGPLGFGLVQRERRFEEFEDLDARFESRPSVWVEAVGDWGAGRVELIEIPSNREANDNIVVFWKPEAPIPKGGPWTLAYRMRWTDQPAFTDDLAEVLATRAGKITDSDRRQFAVDFDLGPLQDVEGVALDVTSSAGKIAKSQLRPIPERGLMRASFELAPEEQTLIELRAQLYAGDRRLSETWLYRWTPT